jgi:hypothetical protein
MTTSAGAARAYSLKSTPSVLYDVYARTLILDTVIQAKDITTIPKDPALYVRPALSGNKLDKTVIIRNRTPTWDQTFPL